VVFERGLEMTRESKERKLGNVEKLANMRVMSASRKVMSTSRKVMLENRMGKWVNRKARWASKKEMSKYMMVR
jgi:hypothetical protein